MPFSLEQFLNIFKDYNQTVFPLQLFFNILALTSIVVLIKNSNYKNKIINGTLAFLWLWIGVVYHLIFFTVINKAAYFFALIFIIQSIIFLYIGFFKNIFVYEFRKDWLGIISILIIIYGLLIYPILAYLFGHKYPYQPTFGLPCPTTIFTFGILLFAKKPIKWYFILLPLIWALIGSTAALKLNIYEDVGLLISGILGYFFVLRNSKS
ncbi:MAG: hypothetical protein IPM32_00070 [Ignavibacteriae bacterium]|nr:hypothetical protein [Ignavibacteriota bacterium]